MDCEILSNLCKEACKKYPRNIMDMSSIERFDCIRYTCEFEKLCKSKKSVKCTFYEDFMVAQSKYNLRKNS